MEKRERFKGNGKETLQDNEGKCPLGTGYEEDILEESMMNRRSLRSYAVCGIFFEISLLPSKNRKIEFGLNKGFLQL